MYEAHYTGNVFCTEGHLNFVFIKILSPESLNQFYQILYLYLRSNVIYNMITIGGIKVQVENQCFGDTLCRLVSHSH